MWAYQWTWFWQCRHTTPRQYQFSWERLWGYSFERARQWWLWPVEERSNHD